MGTVGATRVPEIVKVSFRVYIAGLVLMPLLLIGNLGQDAIPFVTAGQLVKSDPGSIYTKSGSLFDPEKPFFVRSCDLAPTGTDCNNLMVGFVSPPPILLPSLGIGLLGGRLGTMVLRCVGAWSLAGGFVVLWRRMLVRSPQSAPMLLGILLLLLPFAMVAISLGQNSPLMFLSAALGVVVTDRRRNVLLVSGILALCVLFKFSPIVLLAVLVVQKRWRVLSWTVGLLAAASLASLVVFPISLWSDFVTSTLAMGDNALSNPYNGALGAAIHALVPGFVNGLGTMLLDVVVAVCALIGFAYVRRRAGDDVQWAYAWVLLLLVLPLVWWHYVLVAIAALAQLWLERADPRIGRILLIAAVVSIPISIPNARGHSVPIAQALFLVAVAIVIPLVLRTGERDRIAITEPGGN